MPGLPGFKIGADSAEVSLVQIRSVSPAHAEAAIITYRNAIILLMYLRRLTIFKKHLSDIR
jgi:hypothetical protein